ncbi:MAG: hypothetical protein K6A23_11055 [Butyrivibrio sp.]|nr:hypothetical protein [Butyrivibrio sp.]
MSEINRKNMPGAPFEESGPEPTLGIRNNKQLYPDLFWKISFFIGIFLFAIFFIPLKEGEKYGFEFNGKIFTSENWPGSKEYYILLGISCIFLVISLYSVVTLIRRRNARKSVFSGVVVGYRRSGRSASSTNHMDPVIEAFYEGNSEYIRAYTIYGKYAKSYYSIGSQVSFYKLGKEFWIL